MAVPFYIPVSGAGYLAASPHSRQSSLLSDLILAVLVGVKWHRVALIFVPPMASDVERLFLCLLATCTFLGELSAVWVFNTYLYPLSCQLYESLTLSPWPRWGAVRSAWGQT